MNLRPRVCCAALVAPCLQRVLEDADCTGSGGMVCVGAPEVSVQIDVLIERLYSPVLVVQAKQARRLLSLRSFTSLHFAAGQAGSAPPCSIGADRGLAPSRPSGSDFHNRERLGGYWGVHHRPSGVPVPRAQSRSPPGERRPALDLHTSRTRQEHHQQHTHGHPRPQPAYTPSAPPSARRLIFELYIDPLSIDANDNRILLPTSDNRYHTTQLTSDE
ncbi:hypothetical protein CALVIDRAFT_255318 [Calocera viscosa TUFC12733]|uniref:Uncharacterized protein n=1 Tax=Calocera viscosa (strain TUFC12733) TaxID=1330018 RepID=A0A167J8G1_CALVF|nr:hypothetical protein CALVIDRAFT_255318 [Calocera viscosa TUFC12733]